MFAALLAALRVARIGPGRPRTCPDYLVADKGYSSRANRALLRRRGIAHTIPEPRLAVRYTQRLADAGAVLRDDHADRECEGPLPRP
jgi:hypothetical protein